MYIKEESNSTYNFRSNFLDLENEVILVFCVNAWEERKRTERMMSRCFTWFPIGGYRKTQHIPELGGFYKNWGFTWRVPDCEELVEVTHRG